MFKWSITEKYLNPYTKRHKDFIKISSINQPNWHIFRVFTFFFGLERIAFTKTPNKATTQFTKTEKQQQQKPTSKYQLKNQ